MTPGRSRCPNSQLASRHVTPSLYGIAKIPPLPSAARRQLVESYCPPRLRSDVLNDDKNTHCLTRAYLGRRPAIALLKEIDPVQHSLPSLGNFPLHVDQMEALGLADLGAVQYACHG